MNRNEGARKSGTFIAVCLSPDVCKTPVGNICVSVPYQIVASLEEAASVSTNVHFGGAAAFVYDQSKVWTVTGDEAGTAGGVISGTNRALVEPISGSTSVFANDRPVVRHGDTCKMNNGNTIGKFIFQGDSRGGVADHNPQIRPETPEEEAAALERRGLWANIAGMGGRSSKRELMPLGQKGTLLQSVEQQDPGFSNSAEVKQGEDTDTAARRAAVGTAGLSTGGVSIQGTGRIAAVGKHEDAHKRSQKRNFSQQFDFSEMQAAGNYGDMNFALMPVIVTTEDGTYLTILMTDSAGVTNRVFTEESERIIAYAGKGRWEITEEYEVVDVEDDGTGESEDD